MASAESGYVHRHPQHLDQLLTHPPGITTIYDLLTSSFKKFASNPCLGTRKRLPNGKIGDYEFMTYKEVYELSNAFGSGLRALGLQPKQHIGEYTINRTEAVVTEIAAVLHRMPTVSLYDTLGEDTAQYIINHAELVAIVCAADKIKNVLSVLKNCPTLRWIIQIEDVTPAQASAYREQLAGSPVQLISFSAVVQKGRAQPFEHVRPEPGDVYSILYTSGTTGVPKGVMIAHKNFVAAVAGFTAIVPIYAEDVYISYLPMAHVYERVTQMLAYSCGASLGFYQGDITKLADDLQALKPTILAGVPRVYQRLFDRIQLTVRESMWHRRQLFNYAYRTKVDAIQKDERTPILDALVFSKIRERVGGRVRLIVSGSAPLAPELHEFLRACFNCPVLQGYGLSETLAAGTCSSPNSKTYGHVGTPVPCCEIKLVSVPEMNYTIHDQPFPRGEICIRGPNIFAGYYKDPKATEECIEPDGWFHTGDIGLWRPDGTLQIIDRKKNIFKLSQGEYIAAEKLESVYQKSPWVAQIWVYGDSFKDHLVAVVVPKSESVLAWGKSRGAGQELASLCKNEDLNRTVLADLTRLATEAKLKGFEFVKAIYLEPQEFTPENGLTTPTMKLKRAALKEKYAEILKELYAKPVSLPAKL